MLALISNIVLQVWRLHRGGYYMVCVLWQVILLNIKFLHLSIFMCIVLGFFNYCTVFHYVVLPQFIPSSTDEHLGWSMFYYKRCCIAYSWMPPHSGVMKKENLDHLTMSSVINNLFNFSFAWVYFGFIFCLGVIYFKLNV